MCDVHLKLRKAEFSDVDVLFAWANDKKTRQNSFNSHAITYEEHIEWFNRVMNDPDIDQYILDSDYGPIGQVRINIDGIEAEIGYSISNNVRGKGYGHKIIKLIVEQVKRNYPGVKKIIGKVKPSNVASIKCFVDNGFAEEFRQFEYDIT